MSEPLACWYRSDHPGPAAHALVIGVSEYPHRPLGLPDLPAGATSADRFAHWLRDRYPAEGRRLGSIRLLLAPVDEERARVATGPGVHPADREPVLRALHEWARDCRSSPDNVAILYVCGHGVQETDDGGLILVRDAGIVAEHPLDGAVDIAAIREGMVGNEAPRRQWYFADACRVPASALTGQTSAGAGGVRLPPRGGPWPAHRPIFFAAAPGEAAFQDRDGSLFVRALLECLELDARVPLHRAEQDGPERWGITAQSLNTSLARRVHAFAEQGLEIQRVTVNGSHLYDVTFLECGVPSVPVTLALVPTEAEQVEGCAARMFEGEVQALARRALPVVEVPVPAGVWTLEVSFDLPWKGFAKQTFASVNVQPPRARKTVRLR